MRPTNNRMELHYVVLVCAIAVLVLRGWLRARSRFWSQQPVFHTHKLHYWLMKPHVIERGPPRVRPHVNHLRVSTSVVGETNPDVLELVCRFIRAHYMRTQGAVYSPPSEHLLEVLRRSEGPSYLTRHFTPRKLHAGDGTIVADSVMTGVMTARRMEAVIGGSTIPVMYVDNLCVHPRQRGKGVASELIQTHHYDTRIASPSVMVHLFKREGELTQIVPVVKYWTYMYVMPSEPERRLPGGTSVVRVEKTSLADAWEILENTASACAFSALPSIAAFAASVESGLLDPHVLVGPGGPLALYVFRDPSLSHGGERALECVASVRRSSLEAFILGFGKAVASANGRIAASSLLIEALGDNVSLCREYESGRSTRVLGRSPTAYFLYNYSHPTVQAEDALAIA